jgi:hypothetical protein
MKFPEFSRFSRPYTEYFPDNHTLNNDDVYQHQIQFNTSSTITKTNLVEHDDCRRSSTVLLHYSVRLISFNLVVYGTTVAKCALLCMVVLCVSDHDMKTAKFPELILNSLSFP